MEEHMLTQYARNGQLSIQHRFGTIFLAIRAVMGTVAAPGWMTPLCRIPVSAQIFERFSVRS
jgi:hypothetical protein